MYIIYKYDHHHHVRSRRNRHGLSYEYAIYTAENYIISKSKILILKYLVFIKLHYY